MYSLATIAGPLCRVQNSSLQTEGTELAALTSLTAEKLPFRSAMEGPLSPKTNYSVSNIFLFILSKFQNFMVYYTSQIPLLQNVACTLLYGEQL